MTLKEAIKAYRQKFGEGPPIFGLPEDDAIRMIEDAIENGNPIEAGAEKDVDDDAII